MPSSSFLLEETKIMCAVIRLGTEIEICIHVMSLGLTLY